MTMIRWSSILLITAAAGLAAGSCSPQRTCPAPETARRAVREATPPPTERTVVVKECPRPPEKPCREGLEAISREARAHQLVSELLSWHTRTRGERSFQKTLFVGKEKLFSRRTLAYVRGCAKALTDPAERLAAEHLRDYLATTYIDSRTASLDDDITAAELAAKATLSWSKPPVPYAQLPVLLSQEKDAKRRGEIDRALSEIRRTVLNPLYVKKLVRAQELAQWMKYESYLQLSTQAKRVDLSELIRQGDRYLKATDAAYTEITSWVAKEGLGIPFASFRRSDHARAFRATKVEAHLPQALMIAAFKYFLRGIGLDLSTAARTAIVIDDAPHPLKNPRAACYPLVPPADVRITVRSEGGLTSWATFFHEGGHALMGGWTTDPRFEFQQLGSYSLTEAFAELFARSWAEPAWLARYRTFVSEVNRGQHRDLLPPGVKLGRVPELTPALMAYIIRTRLAYDLYLARRYGWAKLIYEAALHGGAESLWKAYYPGSTSDRKALYRNLFQRVYGYPLTEADAESYLADVDPYLYAADYTRAFMLADALHEHLIVKHGKDWYGSPQVGAYLKTFWADGNRYTADDIARKIGMKALDYSASEARLSRLADAAKELTGGQGAPKPGGPARRPAACKPSPKQPAGKCAAPL
jgi:hypothetical protein